MSFLRHMHCLRGAVLLPECMQCESVPSLGMRTTSPFQSWPSKATSWSERLPNGASPGEEVFQHCSDGLMAYGLQSSVHGRWPQHIRAASGQVILTTCRSARLSVVLEARLGDREEPPRQ